MLPALGRSFLISVSLGPADEKPQFPVHYKKTPNLGLPTALNINNPHQKCRNTILNFSDVYCEVRETNTWLGNILN